MNDDRDRERERDNEVEIARRRPTSGAGSVPPERDANRPDPSEPDGHIDAELLAAWIHDPADGTAEQRQAIETHLDDCPVCQATLDDLRAIVLALSALPQVATPRSFALTPEMVAAPKPVNLRETPGRPVVLTESQPWYQRQLAALRWATAVAAILFVFVVSADIIARNPATDSDSDMAGNTMMQTKAEPGAAQDDASTFGGAAIAEDAETLMTDEGQADAASENTSGESTPAAASVAEEPEQAEAESAATEELADTMMEAASDPTTVADEDAALDSADTESASDDDNVAASSATEAEADGEQADTADAARESTGSDDASTDLTVQTPADEGTGKPGNVAAEDADSTWRLLQVGLALLIVWLLAAMIALPRLRTRSSDISE